MREWSQTLPQDVQTFLDLVVLRGFKVIVIGGSVRDTLLGRKNSKDLDCEIHWNKKTSSLNWLKILNEFHLFLRENYQTKINEEFKIAQVQIGKYSIELASARIEQYQKNSNHHKNFIAKFVTGVDFKKYFKRRDFTLNAIGWDWDKQKIIDPFLGVKHLKMKMLYPCSKDFIFDPVRFLRAHRFKVKFGLEFSDQLNNCLIKMPLSELSTFYFQQELIKSGHAGKFYQSLNLMQENFSLKIKENFFNVYKIANYQRIKNLEQVFLECAKLDLFIGIKFEIDANTLKNIDTDLKNIELDKISKIDFISFVNSPETQKLVRIYRAIQRYENLTDFLNLAFNVKQKIKWKTIEKLHLSDALLGQSELQDFLSQNQVPQKLTGLAKLYIHLRALV